MDESTRAYLDEFSAGLLRQIAELKRRMDRWFDVLEAPVETRLPAVPRGDRLAGVQAGPEARLEHVEERLCRVERRIGHVEERLDELGGQVGALDRRVDQLAADVRQRLRFLN